MSTHDIPPEVQAAALTLLGYFVDLVKNEAAKVEPKDNGAPEYYTAKTCGIPPTTFRRLCRNGTLKGARIFGREWHAPRASFDAWREAEATAANTPPARDDTAPTTTRSPEELDKLNRTEGTEAKPARRPRRP